MIAPCENCFNFYAKLVEKINSTTTNVDTNVSNSSNSETAFLVCSSLICIAIITAIFFVLYHLIKNWHENYRDKRKRNWEENDREKNVKSEYRSKKLDYLKDESESYGKILKEFNKKKKKNEEAQSKIKSNISKIKEKLAANTSLSHSVFCEIHDMLTSIEKSLDEIETIEPFDQPSSSTKDNNSILQNAYLNALDEFLGIKKTNTGNLETDKKTQPSDGSQPKTND